MQEIYSKSGLDSGDIYPNQGWIQEIYSKSGLDAGDISLNQGWNVNKY